jgi:hypothetical protein
LAKIKELERALNDKSNELSATTQMYNLKVESLAAAENEAKEFEKLLRSETEKRVADIQRLSEKSTALLAVSYFVFYEFM